MKTLQRRESNQPLAVPIGGLSRDAMLGELQAHGVRLNDYARELLAGEEFQDPGLRQRITVQHCTVADLGYPAGARQVQIHAAAARRGLLPCPLRAAPYLRLALARQEETPAGNGVTGQAPPGSLTIAAPLPRPVGQPTGFYLRVVDGTPWLRGYRCDDEHLWQPGDRFLFRLATGDAVFPATNFPPGPAHW